MTPTPGQDSGHPFVWAHLVDAWAEQHGSLAAAAEALAAERGFAESVESIARGLRRLRKRGTLGGGVWGRRALRAFGVPGDVQGRVRWMGQYHTRFTDLPTSLCLQLLRGWDRPPISESNARVWIQLGWASVELRRRELGPAIARLDAFRPVEPLARAEHALVSAFAHSRRSRDRVPRLLESARSAFEALAPGDDRACLHARWVDQLGYVQNVHERDHAAAHALYAAIPEDGPPFALVRRYNGMGWSALKLGRREQALAHARHSVEVAGDGGSLRLRAMALKLLAAAATGPEAERATARARAIAERLEDEELRFRVRD